MAADAPYDCDRGALDQLGGLQRLGKIAISRRGWHSTIALDTGGPLEVAIHLVRRRGSIKRKTWT
jgi:hypothetical protein